MKQLYLSVAVLLLAVCPLIGQSKPTAFINARIIPISGPVIEQGILLVQDGKIRAVGDARAVRLTADVVQVDLAGKTIMPGLIDSHSHIGGGSGAED